jgi:uncharacterized membrane protein (DUF4010 family)
VNPRKLLMLFALIALLQFAGYAANRLFGARSGLTLSGFLGASYQAQRSLSLCPKRVA